MMGEEYRSELYRWFHRSLWSSITEVTKTSGLTDSRTAGDLAAMLREAANKLEHFDRQSQEKGQMQ